MATVPLPFRNGSANTSVGFKSRCDSGGRTLGRGLVLESCTWQACCLSTTLAQGPRSMMAGSSSCQNLRVRQNDPGQIAGVAVSALDT